MSTLTVYIKSCQVRDKLNYFIVAQLDEIEYPDKQKTSQKFRTDLAHYTEYLRFQKNIFKFDNLSLGNRLVIKFGCFSAAPDIDVNDTGSLLVIQFLLIAQMQKNSKLYASGSYVLSQNFITMLRKDKVLEKDMSLYDQDSVKEMGHLNLVFKLRIDNFEDQIYEDNREIEKVYYDPFNSNEYEIQKNLEKVQGLVMKKHDVMETKMKQMDQRNAALRTLAVDLTYLRKTNDDLINVDEVHIEIDVLAQTPQGINTLKERYVKLMNRFELERKRYDALEKEYFKIEPSLQQIKKLKTQIEEVQRASEDLEFHLARYKDLANRIKAQKETILSQEEIIQNLAHSVKAQVKDGPQQSKELDIRLNDFRYKRERLMERLKQLKLLMKMNDGQLPREYLLKIQDEEVKEYSEEVTRLRKYEDELLTMIQETTKQLDALGPLKNKQNKFYRSTSNFDSYGYGEWNKEKEGLDTQLRYLQNKAFNLEREQQLKSQAQAKHVAELRYQITLAQQKIDEKATLNY
ncbi:UNKNOWN [Stylonychia lemnae]|uniref:Uncharacterized protein n=1 Tax=Stylonychia lemnae TaxID=5949 RepID=A0A078AL76_STYLE|nr:UNKNOWN [Stylonychia lemnae]|eukprot:CDW82949.1 UNKNOWN [Stylonychia lemnae]